MVKAFLNFIENLYLVNHMSDEDPYALCVACNLPFCWTIMIEIDIIYQQTFVDFAIDHAVHKFHLLGLS